MRSKRAERVGPQQRARRARRAEALADRESRNPYLRWLVHLGLPMGISLLAHLGVVALLGLTTWQVFSRRPAQTLEYQAGISRSLAERMNGAFKWPGETVLHTPDVQSFDFAPPEAFASRLRELGRLEIPRPAAGPESFEAGGFGLGTSGRSGILGLGGGAGSGGGGGPGGGFGSGSGIGRAGVWDVRVRANRIAYVVDFSGSIIVAVNDLKRELKRSVGALKEFQSFNVFVFYSRGVGNADRVVTESFAPTLQPARPDVRRRFFRWIDGKTPQGSTRPLQAVRRALALRPEVVFFFSDGYFDEALVEQIGRAARQVRAQIHCLVFDEILLEDTSGLPRMTDGARRLKRIADASGGKTKVVTGADLRGR